MEFKVLPVLAHSGRLAFRCSLFTLYVKKRAAVKEGRMDQMNDKKNPKNQGIGSGYLQSKILKLQVFVVLL